MESTIKLFVDPTKTPSPYWVRIETQYATPAYCANAGTGSLPLQADANGNYHLEVFIEEVAPAYSVSPILHIVDLGELASTNGDTTLTVSVQLVDGGGNTTGTVRLEDAEQESRPDHP